ncbi:MAG: ribonuclease [Marmoricola sp.]|nr:ribonuclease [Marmoricola sp.]
MTLIVTSVRNFLRHHDTDIAAGLTYYSVLSIFPAALALLSLLGLLGDSDQVLRTITDILDKVVSAHTLHDITPTLRTLTRAHGASWTFAAGVAGALWSASGYIGAFSRAMNTLRGVEETRPFWKLRPYILMLTVISVLLLLLALAMITLSGSVASSVGDKLGLGDQVVHVFSIAKWPVLAIVVIIVVAMLFHATPNVKVGRVRLLSPGAFLSLLLGVAASAGFAYYIANFSSYNKTYGSVAGGVIALLWLWLINLALLFGAEVDAARDARAAAEIQSMALPPRSLLGPKAGSRAAGKPGPVYGPVRQPVPEED